MMQLSISSLQAYLPFLSFIFHRTPPPGDSWPRMTFKSSNAQPPNLLISKNGQTDSGLLFSSPFGWTNHDHDSLVIMSDENELIWQSGRATYDAFQPQYLFGEPVLAYWTGTILPLPWGMGIGHIEILDNTYTQIHTVSIAGKEQNFVPAAGLDPSQIQSFIDVHEACITAENTILVTAFNTTPFDLSAFGGPADGWMHDSLFFEVDVKTNKVLHRWSALEHIDELGVSYDDVKYPLGEMGRNKTHPYAFFHMNSVAKFADGSYLISSRHVCSVYQIAKNGTVQWILQGQGTKSSFTHGPGVSFSYQHDARIYRDSGTRLVISLFDNNNDFGRPARPTKGLFITLDSVEMTATMEKVLDDPSDVLSAPVLGNVQSLNNGHIFVGYGYVPTMKEYDARGNVVMNVQYGTEDEAAAYRSYRHAWIGKPAAPPDVFACYDGADTRVYMSWNGSTEHKSWNVLAGNDAQKLFRHKSVASRGFETECQITGKMSYVQAEPEGPNVSAVNSSTVKVRSEC